MKNKLNRKIIFLRIVFWKSYKDYNDEPKKENVTKMGPFAKQRQIMQRPLKDKNR